MGPIEKQISEKLKQKFHPMHLEVANESHMHSVPPGSETHFRVLIVTEQFKSLSRVKRQQLVYGCLQGELKSGVHALGLQTLTPDEWQAGAETLASPACANKAHQK